jgi:hypothetical protein
MAGNVTGNIGNDYVELNNAATESTLQALLNAIQGNSAQVKNLANKSGVNTGSAGNGPSNDNLKANNQTVAENTGMFQKLSTFGKGTADSFKTLDSSISPLIGQLIAGNASVTVLTTAFGELHPLLGIVTNLFGKLIKFQEENMRAYRTMSDAGVNFSGSLTDLRMAAASSYLTLDQFTNMVKNNSTSLAMMGTTVDEGAKKFGVMSNSLIKSKAGDTLLALGYSFEDINGGLLNFVKTTGNAANGQKANTTELTKATANYLVQLDAISQFTGVSRKQMEEDQKKASLNAAYQRKMASLAPAEAAKLKATYDAASASGIKGATDLVMSTALGFAPLTEASQMLTGVLPDAAQGIVNMTNTSMDSNSTMKDVNNGFIATMLGAKKNSDELGRTADALAFGSGTLTEVANSGLAAGNLVTAKGIDNAEKGAAVFDEIQKNQEARGKGQANTMAQSEKAMAGLTTAVTSIVNTLVEIFMPAITFVTGVVNVLTYILETFKTQLMLVGGALLGAYAIGKTYNAVQNMFKKKGSPGSAATGSGKGLFGGLGPLGSKDNPMYVIIVGSGGVADSIAQSVADAVEGSSSKDKSKTRQTRENTAKKLGASKLLKRAGVIGTVIGAGMIGSELYDTESQLKAGKITKEEARTKEGGAIGELAGGAAGGWGGAAAGAALGTMLLPGIGTLVGGAIGGIVGGFGGGKLGELVGKELGKSSVTDKVSKEGKLADAGSGSDQEIIASLRTMAAESEKSRKLQEKSVKHLDDISSNVDTSGPPSFYG